MAYAMKPGKAGMEESVEQIHKIRITLPLRMSKTLRKLLASGSVDKTVKLWDLSNNQPSCVASKNPKAGVVFAVLFSVDNPLLLAIGGSKGKLEVWDTLLEVGDKQVSINRKTEL